MKRTLAIVLIAVFAMSAVGTVFATKSAADVIICRAYCDYDTCRWYVCCPITKSPNSKHIFWECYYGAECCENLP